METSKLVCSFVFLLITEVSYSYVATKKNTVIKQIILIRIKQTFRNIIKIGIFRTLFILFFLTYASLITYDLIKQNSAGILFIILVLSLILTLHLLRTDKSFLNNITVNPQFIYFIEYILFSSPVILLCILTMRIDLIIYQIIGLMLIALLKISYIFKKQNLNNFLIKLIPTECFEIKSGVRHSFWLAVPTYFLCLVFTFWIGTTPIMIFLSLLFFISFYQQCEPRNILEKNEFPPKIFLISKLIINSKVFSIIQIPLLILFMVFHIEYWWIALIEYVFATTVLVFIILLKYSMYSPNDFLNANTIMGIFATLSIVIPFLLPVLILLIVVYYFKAIENLKQHLNAYN